MKMGKNCGWSKRLTDRYGKMERKYLLLNRKVNGRAGKLML
jgi:hypothetical protein